MRSNKRCTNPDAMRRAVPSAHLVRLRAVIDMSQFDTLTAHIVTPRVRNERLNNQNAVALEVVSGAVQTIDLVDPIGSMNSLLTAQTITE